MPATSFAFWATVSVGVSQSVSQSVNLSLKNHTTNNTFPPFPLPQEKWNSHTEEKKKRRKEE